MNVLITGHRGYIGAVLVPLFRQAGHAVTGLDSGLFSDCTFGDDCPPVPELRKDIRDVVVADFEGFDAVVHLAGLSNDPLGDLNPAITLEINHRATIRVASMAKEAGVRRFLYSSSCSLYGAGGQDWLDESAPFNPVTPYGESKILSESDLSLLADDSFSPTYLRNATAYGISARLRGDLVINNLVGYAHTTGEVFIKSDGSPWRPLVHIEDISRAFLAVLEAPVEDVHDLAFNVGTTGENYRVRELADMVQEIVPGSRVRYAEGAEPDERCYRVNCDRIREVLPGFVPRWTVRKGIEEIYQAYEQARLSKEEFLGPRYLRITHLRGLMEQGLVGDDLRWCRQAVAGVRS